MRPWEIPLQNFYWVKKITSGKLENGIFCLIGINGKLLNIHTPIIKTYPANEYYNYMHHFEKDDLAKLRNIFPRHFPSRDKREPLETWGNRIKDDFREIMVNDEFKFNYEENGKKKEIQFKCIG